MICIEIYEEIRNIKKLPNDQRGNISKSLWSQIKELDELQCRTCLNIKTLNNFHIKKKELEKRGYPSWDNQCKLCRSERFKKERHENNTLDFRLKENLGWSKRRANEKGLPYNITLNYLKELYEKQEGKCFYTGLELSLTNGTHRISIDQVIPSRGYTQDNVVLCAFVVNQMKFDLSLEDFVNTIENLHSNIDSIKKLL